MSAKKIALTGFIVAVFGLSYALKQALPEREASEAELGAPDRIVSMAPSITEILYALGLGDKVVGVTRYCLYPPEAQEKTSIGGFLDPNYEAIVALQPDLVVLLPVHNEARDRLERMNVSMLAADHRTLDGILDSITAIGAACGVQEAAEAELAQIRGRMAAIQEITAGRERPRVLLSSGRGLGTGTLDEVYVAGKNQWYDDLITMAGGTNAFTDTGVQFPALSGEGLYRLNPDVIVEFTPDLSTMGLTNEEVTAEWDALSECKAVQEDRVYVIEGDYTMIPGPRFVQALEDVARALHPDADWDRL